MPPLARPVQLPRLLSLLPRDGVNASVYQTRWQDKGIPVPSSPSAAPSASRWEIKKVNLDLSGDKPAGRAWGVLYWKGKRVTPENVEYERIRGGLKYTWGAAVPPPRLVKELRSGTKPPLATEAAPAPAES